MRALGREKTRLLQDDPDRSESEVLQQAAQLRLGGGDVDRVPELGEPVDAYLGLMGVDFPRVQIDDGRLMLARVEGRRRKYPPPAMGRRRPRIETVESGNSAMLSALPLPVPLAIGMRCGKRVAPGIP